MSLLSPQNVGPSTACFCGHRFRQHATDNMKGKQRHAKDIRCTEPGCKCAAQCAVQRLAENPHRRQERRPLRECEAGRA